MICSIPGCDNELSPRSRLRTCATCRSNLHRWFKRRPAEVLAYSHQLRKRQGRMNTFAVVKDDNVTLVERDVLTKRRVMTFPKRRKSA